MNPEIKEKWLTALRSGDYKQGKDALRADDGLAVTHCCLGVLCDIYSQEMGVPWEEGYSSSYMHGNSGNLPPQVQDWSGMDSHGSFSLEGSDPEEFNPCGNGDTGYLTEVNDRSNDFDTVIRIIEEKF